LINHGEKQKNTVLILTLFLQITHSLTKNVILNIAYMRPFVFMILYSRNDCPICEDAEEILQSLAIAFEYVDIDTDASLRKKYHVRVPVLVNKNNEELSWPFTQENLKGFGDD
jgi:glutaredoxin